MDTRQLAAFCAVVERRSFSQAADRLGVTQPAVSLQVRTLEKRLGTQLLDRSGRRVEPTEAGWRLYRGAQRMLALEESARRRRGGLRRGRPGGRSPARRVHGAGGCRRPGRARRVPAPEPGCSRLSHGLGHALDRGASRRARARARNRRRGAPASGRSVRAVLLRPGHPRLPAGPPLREPHRHARGAARASS